MKGGVFRVMAGMGNCKKRAQQPLRPFAINPLADQAMVWRMSFPLTMKMTISATLVAWSAIRSRHLEM